MRHLLLLSVTALIGCQQAPPPAPTPPVKSLTTDFEQCNMEAERIYASRNDSQAFSDIGHYTLQCMSLRGYASNDDARECIPKNKQEDSIEQYSRNVSIHEQDPLCYTKFNEP